MTMFTDFLKLTINKTILALALLGLLALIIVAGCISTEKSIKKVSRTEASQTTSQQSKKVSAQPSKLITVSKPPSASGMDPDQLQIIGQKIFQNETGGKVNNLIFWSENEAFPSLGVGHFIWFPAGRSLGFTESFPEMIRYLQASGAAVPDWLSEQITIGALWDSREQLEQERGSDKFQSFSNY